MQPKSAGQDPQMTYDRAITAPTNSYDATVVSRDGSALESVGSGYLPSLDGWRAIAILLVLVGHGFESLFCGSATSSACRLTRVGDNGVNLFFALSGFLITSRLLAERRTNGRIALRSFYVRRVFRIVPPALAYIAIIAVLGTASLVPVSPLELVSSTFFFRNYLPTFLDEVTGAGWYSAHFWSLSVEEHFYLLWPALLLLLRGRRAIVAAILLILGTTAWRALDARWLWSASVFGPDVFGTRTDVRLDGLLAGCLLALLIHRTAVRTILARLASPVVLITAFSLFVGLLHPLSQKLPIQVILAPLLIGATVVRPNSQVGRILENDGLRWIGHLSYSLYIWQQLFLVPVEFGTDANLIDLGVRLIALTACAAVSYYAIERPSIEFGRRLAGASRRRAIQTAVPVVGGK